MSALDLSFLSLYRVSGQEWPQLPGLLALSPPKRAARGREHDRLVIYLTLAGNRPRTTGDYAELTGKIADTFYGTPGSLTFALKSAVEAVNTALAEENMRTTGQGQYTIGALVLAALRGDQTYLVQSGPTHVFWLNSGGPRHLVDSALAGKGLGLSQTAKMYFAQVGIRAGDQLLFCAALPPNWEKSIMDERGPVPAEILRRRLMILTPTNISATLVEASEGAGQMHILHPIPAATVEKPVENPPKPVEKPAEAVEKPVEVHPVAGEAVSSQILPASFAAAQPPAPEPPPAAPANIPAPEPEEEPESYIPPAARRVMPRNTPRPAAAVSAERKEQTQKTALWLAQAIHGVRGASQKLSGALGNFLPRLLPGEEGDGGLSKNWLIFIALAIPAFVVTMAAVVYFQWGQSTQYETYYARAVAAGMETLNTNNPTELRVKWKTTLDWLDQAESFKETAASQKLRGDAQRALDSLDRVTRLNFRPVFGVALSRALRVTQMAASDTDIYLLNDADGSVIRGVLNSSAYDLRAFNCQPGQYPGANVGPLVDIIALPRSSANGATLLGVDSIGNLLYCIPDAAPQAAFLQMPELGWGRVTAAAYDSGNLYILDADRNAVWVYFGQAGLKFPEKPLFFFEEQIPPLNDVLDMAVHADDLYLLHSDGHLTSCTLSRIASAPTRCIDPAPFIDTRPGFDGGVTLADGIFTQILFTPAPDPAVTLLEPYTQSIFRFSPRQMELQNQIRPLAGNNNPFPAGQPITAMAFSPNKVVFVFVGGQAYFAPNTP